MKKYRVMIEIYASKSAEVEMDDGASMENVIDTVYHDLSGTLCHQCSGQIDLGDPGDVLEVIDVETGEPVPFGEDAS